MKKIRALNMTLAFLLSALAGVASESFRVTQALEARVDSALPEGVSLSIGYNDGLFVILPEDRTFIKAVQIEVKSPASILDLPSSIGYALYAGISPLPESSMDFSGEKLAMDALPQKITFALQIPLQEGHGLKSDPYTEVLPEIPPESGCPLFFRLFPIMKGIPDDFEEAAFSVNVKPVLAGEGGLALSIAFPEDYLNEAGAEASRLSVRIDENPVPEPGKLQILAQGEHHLAVSAERCRTEVRAFTIERGKVTRLSVEMKDAAPTVSFAAPSNVQILLDGEPVPDPRGVHKIESGRHTVMFSIGDYMLQRQFTAEEGRDYSVSMIVDAEIVELK